MRTITVNNSYSALYGWRSVPAMEIFEDTEYWWSIESKVINNLKYIQFKDFEIDEQDTDGGEALTWYFDSQDTFEFGKNLFSDGKMFVSFKGNKINLSAQEFEDFLNNGFTDYTTPQGVINYDSIVNKIKEYRHIVFENDDVNESLLNKFLNNIIFYYKD